MAVDLSLVPFLDTQKNLRRNNTFLRVSKAQVGVKTERGGILEEMGSCLESRSGWIRVLNLTLHKVRLEYPKKSQAVEDSRVDFTSAIRDNANNDLY